MMREYTCNTQESMTNAEVARLLAASAGVLWGPAYAVHTLRASHL